ncbi:sensor histidine kinase, partial [Streptomyces lasiicapitis]
MNVRTRLERLLEAVRRAVRDARHPSGPPLQPTRRAWQFDVLVALVNGVSPGYTGIDNVDNDVLREIA